jgi:hypothetical protein
MPVATRWIDERATPALGIRPSACKANRPVSGWGQGRQPPEAVARSASLEASRSQVYFKNTVAPRSIGLFATVARGLTFCPHPVGADTTSANLTPASGRQDHTTSPYASVPFVSSPFDRSRTPTRETRPASRCAPDTAASTAPHPASVTIAIRPWWGRMARICRDDLPDG